MTTAARPPAGTVAAPAADRAAVRGMGPALPGLVGAAVMTLGWLPLGAAFLAPLGAALLFVGLARVDSGRSALRFGVAVQVARFAVGAHFLLALVRHSPLGLLLYPAAMLYIVPYGAFEGWGAWQLEKRARLPRPAAYIALVMLSEFVRTRGELSFPADLHAHGLAHVPSLVAIARWGGPLLVTLVLLAAGALLARAWARRAAPVRALVPAACAAALWIGPPLLVPPLPPDPVAAPATLRVGLVQPAVPLAEKLDRTRWPATWEKLRTLSAQAARDADLVVWPETARPGPLFWDEREPFRDPPMEDLSRQLGVPILYGCEIARVTGRRPVALYNAIALARPDGSPGAWYGKQRLLPFIEGLPFARLLGYDPARRAAAGRGSVLTLLGNFSPGPGPVVFDVGTARLGVLVCYESQYPNLARAARRAGADVLVVLTNDQWWGRWIFPEWHARLVATRAAELDVPVLRAANNGISCLVERDGRTVARTELDEVRTLAVTLRPAGKATTLYARCGDWPAGLAVLVMAGAWLAGRRRS